MTIEKIMALAKEKLGRDITEQEAQGYLSGEVALPEEALDLVSGGSGCGYSTCSKCGSSDIQFSSKDWSTYCRSCGAILG